MHARVDMDERAGSLPDIFNDGAVWVVEYGDYTIVFDGPAAKRLALSFATIPREQFDDA